MQTQRGFRQLNNNRNFGSTGTQDQPTQQNLGYNQREEEPVVGWLNIMAEGESGERRKLGKGIPLRDSNPLERAILDMFFNEDGSRNDADANELFDSLHIDLRSNGNNEDFVLTKAKKRPVAEDELDQIEEVKPTRKRVTTKPTE